LVPVLIRDQESICANVIARSDGTGPQLTRYAAKQTRNAVAAS
jgi:hypothetical protein